MKKLLISLITVILFCAMALGVCAEWQNPFKDVKESAWYYDAVKTTVEKGIFTGVSEGRFDPNGKMTRAMFMTTLANMVGAEVGEYKGLPFTDVKAKHWYAPYVQWAYDNGISSGMSADRFGVNDPITREQMVTLFYNTAAKFGADTTVTDTYKFDKVYDDAKIRDYAVEAMKWAMQNSIISGTGVEGKEIIVDPWGTATRAQAAQIITMYLKFTEKDMPYVTDLTINGNPIESYTIVYGAEHPYPASAQYAANALKDYIKTTTGFELDITNDSQEPEGPEILVGITNRESMGLVSADRDGEGDESFEISVQGNFVLIAGKSDNKNYDGTSFGVYAFVEEILDVEYYSDGVTVYNTIRGRDIPNGYEFKDSPGFEYRAMYWGPLGRDEFSMGDTYMKGWGFAHTIYRLVGFGDAGSENPCLTDPENIAKIEENFLANITPEHDHFWVGQNDSGKFCTCANCKAVNNEEGCRGGTMFRLVNRLAKLAEEHGCGDVEIHTLAYDYTFKPCKTKLDDSIVVYYAPVQSCPLHPYNETKNCKTNKSITKDLAQWDSITNKMFVWDYSTNFKYSQTPLPLTKVLRENFNWFYANGIRGEFNNATSDEVGKLAALKAYLIAELMWDPDMTEDVYRDKIKSFLNAYYGPGGNYMNQYVELLERLSDGSCSGYSGHPASVIPNNVVLDNNDKVCKLLDAAEAMCENEEQRIRIRKTRISWTYMYLDALHTQTYEKGTDEQRAEYERLATELYEEAKNYNLCWSNSGSIGEEMNFNAQRSPINW